MYTWIALEGKQKPKRKQLLTIHPFEHPRNPSFEVKLEAIKRCFEMGESVKSVYEDIGYNHATIYNWRIRKFRAPVSENSVQAFPIGRASPIMDVNTDSCVNSLRRSITMIDYREILRLKNLG
ncbi:transposase, partial [Eubacterium barkeri]|uniref:transposase n=1 Tax=Eubacterium barkeri TaxID=1528 RepID=UPI001A9A4779